MVRHDESMDRVSQYELKKARGSYNKFSEMTKALWDKVSGNRAQMETIASVHESITGVNISLLKESVTNGLVSIIGMAEGVVTNINMVKPIDTIDIATGVVVDLIEGEEITNSGITFLLNADGTVTYSGTATATLYLRCETPPSSAYQYKKVKASVWCDEDSLPAEIQPKSGIYFDGATYAYGLSGSTKEKEGIATGFESIQMYVRIGSGGTLTDFTMGIMLEQSTVNNSVLSDEYVQSETVSFSLSSELELALPYDLNNIFTDSEIIVSYGYKTETLIDIIASNRYAIKSNPLDGEIVMGAGDSIMVGLSYSGGFCTALAERNPMTTFINIGIGGNTITQRNGTTTYIEYRFDLYTGEDPDRIFFNGMMNDYLTQQPLGAITVGYLATLDVATFYGAFENLCKRMRTDYPSAKLMFLGTHNYDNGGAITMKQYRDAALECCDKWAIPYVDMYTIGRNTRIAGQSIFYSDNIHPNELGYRDKIEVVEHAIVVS